MLLSFDTKDHPPGHESQELCEQNIWQLLAKRVRGVAVRRVTNEQNVHNLCRAADDVALERSRNIRSGSSARVELDPWLTESRVVSAHTSLHATQVWLKVSIIP